MLIQRKANILEVLADSGLFAERLFEHIDQHSKADSLTNYEWDIDCTKTHNGFPGTRETPAEGAEYDIDYTPERIADEVAREVCSLFADKELCIMRCVEQLARMAMFEYEQKWQDKNLDEAISREEGWEEDV